MKKFARAAVLMVLVFGRPQAQASSLIEFIEPDYQEEIGRASCRERVLRLV